MAGLVEGGTLIGVCVLLLLLLLVTVPTGDDSSVVPNKIVRMASSEASTAPAPGEYSVAFVTVPDNTVAVNVARQLVEKSLVACVNIIPGLTSIYAWEGKINEDPEVLLMIKTRTSRVEDLIRHVREVHPYSVAEVIAMPIAQGNAPYLDWIGKTVGPRGGRGGGTA
ncbi:divalent-cation tolerance protein CutA isoform X1 [Anopheles stephensi]|uniref:divalent-cation tolerance protein CutA isoform X1 n=1 Tax=Anopheles stephensi TaxID=30069 RepID=UPI0016588DEE|nr:divalent-cation tolerance protein CutA isoform X1 [Anopheles stephensi]